MIKKISSFFIIILAILLCISTSLLSLISWHNPIARAINMMTWGLIIFWIIIGGGLMYHHREKIKQYVLSKQFDWKIKFVLFATLLALTEEAITTTMTNLAPIFGVKVGEAYITASANYFDVIFFHSVIMLIPFFIAWMYLLKKYQFSSFAVFVLYGVTGLFLEIIFGGIVQLFGFAQWIFVYGLMLFLPAYTLPEVRGAQKPSVWNYVLAIPYTFLLAAPLLIINFLIISVLLKHPAIDFQLITTN